MSGEDQFIECNLCGKKYHGSKVTVYMRQHVRNCGTSKEEWYWECISHRWDDSKKSSKKKDK